jgi:hypothetical protein
MKLDEIINIKTMPRIFSEAFEQNKVLICMDQIGSYFIKGGEYKIQNIFEKDTDKFCLWIKGFHGGWWASRFKVKE